MSRPKFQHYVPRFYLEYFTDPSGKLFAYDKTTDRILTVRPGTIAAENYFYDIPELEGLGAPRHLMESQFAEVEGAAKAIIDRWIKELSACGTVSVPPADREAVALFLSLQLIRTAEFRTLMTEWAQNLKGGPGGDPKNPRSLHTALLWNDEYLGEIRTKLLDCIWIFGFNDSAQGFYTSDHPALVKPPDHSGVLLGPRVLLPGMYVAYPLSPQWIMYAKDREYWAKLKLDKFENRKSPVKFSVDMVNHENSGQVGTCTRFVFSNSPDFSFAKDYCARCPGVTPPARRRSDGPPDYRADP